VTHPQEDLTALADGALPSARAEEVRRHLAGCAACRAEHAHLAATLAALRSLPPAPEPSPLFGTRLAARLAQEERRPRGVLAGLAARWRIAVPVGALAALAAAVVVTVRAQRAEEQALAAHLELLADYELVASLDAVESQEDADLVAHLDELDLTTPREGHP
jgi:anti-sigma factor RsiW